MTDEPDRPSEPFHDPRMRGFRSRSAVADVVALIDRRVGRLGSEMVDLAGAAGRVLAEGIGAERPVPPFDRAAMDGYALRGEETTGADRTQPVSLRLLGASRPGRAFPGSVGPGEAVQIMTGAPVPAGADAVVKVESTRTDGTLVQVFEAVLPGRNVGRRGEDIAPGEAVLPTGRVLRPQDLGVLSALAVGMVPVVRRPRVAILITGDELLPPGTPARGDQIADMNSVMLAALIARDGGLPQVIGPLADDRAGLREAIVAATASSDVVLVSGGSSTGPEDHPPGLVAELGELAVHGVALRPAGPAGVGFVGGVPIVLLPGNPVSCLCAYDFFAGRMVRRLGGRNTNWPYRSVARPLARPLASALGRVDYVRVRLNLDEVEPLTIHGASVLSSTTRADGFVIVPADLEGYPAGADMTVWLYDI